MRAKISTTSHQQGVALIMVLIIVALMVIIATQLVAERNLHARRTSNIILSDNAWEFALGAEKLAAIALVKSLKNEDTVHLEQAWALNQVVFPIDGGSITAELKDLRSCFNLNGVLATSKKNSSGEGENEPNNSASKQDANKPLAGELVFSELLTDLQIEDINPKALAATLRDWLDEDQQPAGIDGREDYEYEGRTLPYRTANTLLGSRTELATISGYNGDLIARILPYICIIPGVTDLVLNVNTIAKDQPELLSSFYDKLDKNTASSILSVRPAKGFDKNSFNAELPADVRLHPGAQIDFTSPYFSMTAKVALARTRVNLKSLFEYQGDSNDIIILARMGIND